MQSSRNAPPLLLGGEGNAKYSECASVGSVVMSYGESAYVVGGIKLLACHVNAKIAGHVHRPERSQGHEPELVRFL